MNSLHKKRKKEKTLAQEHYFQFLGTKLPIYELKDDTFLNYL